MSSVVMANVPFYFAQLLCMVLLTYVVGGGVLALIEKDAYEKARSCPYEYVFKACVWGFATIVPLFAIVWTRGNSIMWLPVLLLFWLGYKGQKQGGGGAWTFSRWNMRYVALSLPVFTVAFAALFYAFFIYSGGKLWWDDVFYGNASAHLALQHIETTNLFVETRQAAPYHFGDLWPTALCGTLFHANFLYTLQLVTYPFFLSLVVIGGIALAQRHLKRWPLALLFGVGLCLALPLTNVVKGWAGSMLSMRKYALIYLFVLLFLMYMRERRWMYAYTVPLLLVPFYSTLAPFALPMVCVLAVWHALERGSSLWRALVANPYIYMSVGVFVLYMAFYTLQGIGLSGASAHVGCIDAPAAMWMSMKEIILYCAKRTGRIFMLLPSVLAIGFLVRERRKDWMGLTVAVGAGLMFASLVAALLLPFVKDAGQVLGNTYPVLVVLCWYAVLWVLERFSRFGQLCGVGVFLLYYVLMLPVRTIWVAVWPTMQTPLVAEEIQALETVKAELCVHPQWQIGYYRNYATVPEGSEELYRLRLVYPFDILPRLTPRGQYVPICLSAPDIPEDVQRIYNERHKSVLLNYLCTHAGTLSPEELTLQFMRQRNIGYVVVEQGACLPAYLLPMAQQVAVFRGDELYKITYPNL